MRVKIQLIRSVGWGGIRGQNSAFKHPLGGLAVAACYDTDPSPTPPTGVYSNLATAGLPGGAGVLPADPANYAIQGLCIVGPRGAVPFTVLSAQHRFAASAVYQIPIELPGPPPALTSNNTNVLRSALWKRNVLDLYNTPMELYGKITGGSVFRNSNTIAVAPENNSFTTINADYLIAPGYSTVDRFSDDEAIPGLLATVNESIRYRQSALGLGRFMGQDQNMLNYTAMEQFYISNVLGAEVQHNNGGSVQSVWEVEIDDAILNETASLSGALYAIASGAVPAAWFGVEEFINTSSGSPVTILGKANASPYFDSGSPEYLYVNLTRPLGTNPLATTINYSALYNQIGGADLGATVQVASYLGLQTVSDVGVSILR